MKKVERKRRWIPEHKKTGSYSILNDLLIQSFHTLMIWSMTSDEILDPIYYNLVMMTQYLSDLRVARWKSGRIYLQIRTNSRSSQVFCRKVTVMTTITTSTTIIPFYFTHYIMSLLLSPKPTTSYPTMTTTPPPTTSIQWIPDSHESANAVSGRQVHDGSAVPHGLSR